MDEQADAIAAARAALDQMTAWYGVFGEGLASIQQTLLDAGLDRDTVRLIVVQQHKNLIDLSHG